MDVNHSVNITPSSNTSPEMHGFMSTGSFELPNYYSCPSSREVKLIAIHFLLDQRLHSNKSSIFLPVSYARYHVFFAFFCFFFLLIIKQQADQEAKQSSFMELQKEEIEIFWNQQLFEIQNTTGLFFLLVQILIFLLSLVIATVLSQCPKIKTKTYKSK